MVLFIGGQFPSATGKLQRKRRQQQGDVWRDGLPGRDDGCIGRVVVCATGFGGRRGGARYARYTAEIEGRDGAPFHGTHCLQRYSITLLGSPFPMTSENFRRMSCQPRGVQHRGSMRDDSGTPPPSLRFDQQLFCKPHLLLKPPMGVAQDKWRGSGDCGGRRCEAIGCTNCGCHCSSPVCSLHACWQRVHRPRDPGFD